jgi:hypothetical protein
MAWREGGGFLRSWEKRLERKSAFERACFFACGRGSHGSSSSAYSGREPTLRLSPGEALILVLLFSLGLWVLIWGAVSLLAL